MKRLVPRRAGKSVSLRLLVASVLCASVGRAQSRQEPGRSIGTITTQGNLIVMTLNDGVLGKANLFDLAHRTLRFTPDGGGYRVENLGQWDAEFGSPMTNNRATLAGFAFPFSGKSWNSLSIGITGSLTFDQSPPVSTDGRGGRGGGGGLSVDRFAELQEAASKFVNTTPAISVFFKPRMSGTRYLKELADRAVVTWTLTEPVGGIQDMTWTPTVNRFQAVLHKNGTIELSYDDVRAEDGIVGVYPAVDKGVEQASASVAAVDFSSVKKSDGPFAAVYEAFHYMKPPRAVDLTCTVINALGDKFDMLAYYSDFRIDNPEAGTSSSGPLGGGPAGGAVTGIGANQRNLANYCTQGRFQWQYIQPMYVGANQMEEYPPAGIIDSNTHNIMAYTHQLGERTSNGRIPPYDYAMSQIGHEMAHRWSAFVSAAVNSETIPLGPTHWARGLQAPAPFPFQRPMEASAMGGGVWQDNLDGTFTQLDDDYYVPATGYSYLDLYLMGLIASSEVPDFFILRNLVAPGRDANGHPIFKADRTKVTIEDVIASRAAAARRRPRAEAVQHRNGRRRRTRQDAEQGAARADGGDSPAVDGLLDDDNRSPLDDDDESLTLRQAAGTGHGGAKSNARTAAIRAQSATFFVTSTMPDSRHDMASRTSFTKLRDTELHSFGEINSASTRPASFHAS